jgi:hypothetical protein
MCAFKAITNQQFTFRAVQGQFGASVRYWWQRDRIVPEKPARGLDNEAACQVRHEKADVNGLNRRRGPKLFSAANMNETNPDESRIEAAAPDGV